MPIMAAKGWSDARAAARLLAQTAIECLRNPNAAKNWEVGLNNVYRLLEAYRGNQFFGLEPVVRAGTDRALEPLAATSVVEQHVREVRIALDEAISAAFVGQSQDQAIGAIEDTLRGVAYPDRFKQPSQAERDMAARFFEEVFTRLKLA